MCEKDVKDETGTETEQKTEKKAKDESERCQMSPEEIDFFGVCGEA